MAYAEFSTLADSKVTTETVIVLFVFGLRVSLVSLSPVDIVNLAL